MHSFVLVVVVVGGVRYLSLDYSSQGFVMRLHLNSWGILMLDIAHQVALFRSALAYVSHEIVVVEGSNNESGLVSNLE